MVTALQRLEDELLSHAHYSESDLQNKLMEVCSIPKTAEAYSYLLLKCNFADKYVKLWSVVHNYCNTHMCVVVRSIHPLLKVCIRRVNRSFIPRPVRARY